MTKTYFRIQRADRDVTELLDPGYQFSSAYNRNPKLTRVGVSTCESLEDLATYLTSGQAGAVEQPVRDRPSAWVIVELAGEELPGAVDEMETLVRPTAIISVTSAVDGFMDLVAAQDAFLAGLNPSDDWTDEVVEIDPFTGAPLR